MFTIAYAGIGGKVLKMKLLVLSDSHGELTYMQLAYEREKPDVVIHLGDLIPDAKGFLQANPGMRLLQVAGNCDGYHFDPGISERMVTELDGVRFFITHGHKQKVKFGLMLLNFAAQEAGAEVALFGHTHTAHCKKHGGLWMLNPGSCNSSRGSYGVIEIRNQKPDCKIVWFQDM